MIRSFQYLHKSAHHVGGHVDVRLDALSNTHSFAKAGLMVRGRLDSNAAAVIISLKPNNESSSCTVPAQAHR